MELETIQPIAFMALSIATWQMIFAFVIYITKVEFKKGDEDDDSISFGEALMFSFGGIPGCSSFNEYVPKDAGAITMTIIYTLVMYGIFMYWMVQLFVAPFMEEPEPEPEPKKKSKKKSKPEEDFNNENDNGEDGESLDDLLKEAKK